MSTHAALHIKEQFPLSVHIRVDWQHSKVATSHELRSAQHKSLASSAYAVLVNDDRLQHEQSTADYSANHDTDTCSIILPSTIYIGSMYWAGGTVHDN